MKQALEMALEALENKFLFIAGDGEAIDLRAKAITAIKEALAQPEQEPVAKTVWVVGGKTWQQICATQEDVHKLIADMGMNTPSLYPSMSEVPVLSYTTPPQRKPLTDEQIEREWQFLHDEEGNPPDHHDFARAIEAAHGIKE